MDILIEPLFFLSLKMSDQLLFIPGADQQVKMIGQQAVGKNTGYRQNMLCQVGQEETVVFF